MRNEQLSWLVRQPIAHRGLHDMNKTRWENTLAAFEAAAVHGYAIECDVHLTSDGVPVVFHDRNLKRLTGTEGEVWQRSAGELTSLAIGGTDERVPTLDQMLALVAGRVPIVVELKGVPGHDDGLVERVCEKLRGYGGEAAIMSFDHWLIRQFPAHSGDIPAGLTACGALPHEIEQHFSMLANGISFVSYGVFDLPNPFISFVRERLSMPVISWTVRDKAAVTKTFDHVDQMTFEGFMPEAAPVA
ncbi:glycerophosphodiester phosphodiesterase [Mesorhizobium sp. NBSH29]|uniref:glycerophosphodiester phosphodiesterase n=1 Tax=Mesorhizobium sp. NBSH29 TaxID=2654249 RepID=UPI0018969C10|nr:glycerophosphodiester phosphodiesterase [Mesorhizobium sp. NBSH29]QPC87678.1 glycerophosphodiester phosphodiesterase [Mesorhizobium sp. NBSH29]